MNFIPFSYLPSYLFSFDLSRINNLFLLGKTSITRTMVNNREMEIMGEFKRIRVKI